MAADGPPAEPHGHQRRPVVRRAGRLGAAARGPAASGSSARSRAFASACASRGWGSGRRSGRTIRTSISTCTCTTSRCRRPATAPRCEAFVGDRMAMPLDRARALWEFHLVDGYGSGCAVVARMHHAIADGIALARVLFSLTDAGPEAIDMDEAFRAAAGRRRARRAHPSRRRGHLPRSRRRGRGVARGPRDGRPSAPRGRARADGRGGHADARQGAGRPPGHRHRPARHARASPSAWRGRSRSRSTPFATSRTPTARRSTTCSSPRRPAPCGTYLLGRDSIVDEIHAIVPFNLRPLDEPLPQRPREPLRPRDPAAAGRARRAPRAGCAR